QGRRAGAAQELRRAVASTRALHVAAAAGDVRQRVLVLSDAGQRGAVAVRRAGAGGVLSHAGIAAGALRSGIAAGGNLSAAIRTEQVAGQSLRGGSGPQLLLDDLVSRGVLDHQPGNDGGGLPQDILRAPQSACALDQSGPRDAPPIMSKNSDKTAYYE